MYVGLDRAKNTVHTCTHRICSENASVKGCCSLTPYTHIFRVGQNHIYIRYVYGIFGREITIYTVIYGVYIRFWPTLHICRVGKNCVWNSVYGSIYGVYTGTI